MNLCSLKKNETARVLSVKGNEKLKRRLLALGFIKGTKVTRKGCAPLGDPIIINIREFNLAIRKKDAQHILIF